MAVRSTWYERDLPVLEAIVTYFDEHELEGLIPSVADLAELTGLDAGQVFSACRALDGEYIDFTMFLSGGDPTPHIVERIHTSARRATGQWPSADAWADRIVRGLVEAADAEPDPEKKSKLKTAAEAMSGFGRDVLVGVISGGITNAGGLG